MRSNLARYLREARLGASILITSHDTVIAELNPPSHRLRTARQPGVLRGQIRIGKLQADIGAIERAVIRNGFKRLAVTPPHLAALSVLPIHHWDPFDPMLIAQAITEDATFLSEDKNAASYPVQLQRCRDV